MNDMPRDDEVGDPGGSADDVASERARMRDAVQRLRESGQVQSGGIGWGEDPDVEELTQGLGWTDEQKAMLSDEDAADRETKAVEAEQAGDKDRAQHLRDAAARFRARANEFRARASAARVAERREPLRRAPERRSGRQARAHSASRGPGRASPGGDDGEPGEPGDPPGDPSEVLDYLTGRIAGVVHELRLADDAQDERLLDAVRGLFVLADRLTGVERRFEAFLAEWRAFCDRWEES